MQQFSEEHLLRLNAVVGVQGKVNDMGQLTSCAACGSIRRFHDGSAPDLLTVVNHYDQLFGLNLTPAQKADLVEFLKSL